MEKHDLTTTEQDPVSGYASADVLDETATAEGEPPADNDEARDPMSGYVSADALDQPPTPGTHADPERDAFSGYASADALEPGPEASS